MKRDILQYPNTILTMNCLYVESITRDIRRVVKDLIHSLPDHGIGLAAPQIGVPVRVAIVLIDDEPVPLINPVIVRRKGLRVVQEGCLSLEGEQLAVVRSKLVRLRATNLDGKEFQIRARGDILAQALEHEVDHLNGTLYTQREA